MTLESLIEEKKLTGKKRLAVLERFKKGAKSLFYSLAFSLALGVAYCGGNSNNLTGCRNDNDCREPRICENGECVYPSHNYTKVPKLSNNYWNFIYIKFPIKYSEIWEF